LQYWYLHYIAGGPEKHEFYIFYFLQCKFIKLLMF
jgi:hypothetical protein